MDIGFIIKTLLVFS